jgi:hypothetical protein
MIKIKHELDEDIVFMSERKLVKSPEKAQRKVSSKWKHNEASVVQNKPSHIEADPKDKKVPATPIFVSKSKA